MPEGSRGARSAASNRWRPVNPGARTPSAAAQDATMSAAYCNRLSRQRGTSPTVGGMSSTGKVRSIAVGSAAGLAAAGLWGTSVALAPPVPGNAVVAMLAIFTAMAAVGRLRLGRSGVVAALTAGWVGSWLIFVAVAVMMPRVPDRWVPTIVTQAMNPAANVRESRIEAVDPYVLPLVLGFLMALALVVALLPRIHRRLLALAMPPVQPSPVAQVR